MMKAAPEKAFDVAKADSSLQSLVVSFDNSALLGESHQFPQRDLLQQIEIQYLRGFVSPLIWDTGPGFENRRVQVLVIA